MSISTGPRDVGPQRGADVTPAFPQASAGRAQDEGGPTQDGGHRIRRIVGRIRRFIDARGRATALVLKWAVALAGVAVICAGVVMLVVPGPGIVTILAGVAILGVLSPRLERLLYRFIGWAQREWERLKTRWASSRARADRVG
ncbi:PGPGW domain-containing protein [Schaalia naturae]|jgi:hypothetical protein|uniref:PGPGW domain-containing protein n=1 Tax=Schaalia naturae TaxID=635203 RepID=A0ABW2SQ52_9ACTO